MKQDRIDKSERLKQAFARGDVHDAHLPVEVDGKVLPVQKLVIFDSTETFAVLFQHTGIDETGEVKRLERRLAAEARRENVVLLSSIEVIDAGGAEVMTNFRSNAWKCEE